MISIRTPGCRRLVLVGLIALGSALLPAVASTASTNARVDADRKPIDIPKDGAPDEAPRAVTAVALDEQLRQTTGDLFAGLEIADDGNGGAIIVHAVDDGSTRTNDAVDRVIEELHERGLRRSQVTIEPAAVTLANLTDRQDVLTAHVEDLQSRGTRLVYWAAAVTSNTLEVGVEHLDERSRGDIVALVGSDALTLRQVLPNVETSRTTDSSPWYGGDLLSPIPIGGTCTSGFSVRDSSGVTYDTTAGHCGSGTFKQNGQGYGITISMNYCNYCNGDDQTISTYPGSSTGRVFTSTTGTVKVGSYALASYAGDIICTDGYFTGESCNVRVDLTALCATFGTITNCGLDTMHSLSGATVIQPGDSGGPLYDYRTDGRLNARGLQKATRGCGANPCSSGYFVPMNQVLATHGVSILTVP